MKGATWRALLALGLAAGVPAAMVGCTTESYCFANCTEDAGAGGAAGVGGAGGAAGGAAGASGSVSVVGGSSGAGTAGDGGSAGSAGGCAADLATDPLNCGTCGNKCSLPGAFPACQQGKCVIQQCGPGRFDLDKNPDNGCEYACVPTEPPTEVCDAVDNDCNGKIDEGSDLQNSPDNCGACGVSCAQDLPNTTATACVEGLCAITTCAPGFGDANKVASDGCEYACPVNPPVEEVCDGQDNDCDGNVDNGNPGGGQPCTETCPGGVCQGECTPGTRQCAGDGSYLCTAGVGPSIEVCDGKDNDCNGTVDDGFDTKVDPNNCGVCGQKCEYANGVGQCVDSGCQLVECKPGFANLNDDLSDGCEYTCASPVPGVEVCDGIDNDCNGTVDDTAIVPPDGFCNSKPGTLCAGTAPVCQGAKGWVCPYGPGVEVDDKGALRGVETLCDGLDGNCDGQVDETFPLVGQACDDGGVGACRGTGTYACNDAKDGLTCVISTPGQGGPQPEACDGKDNDCNGLVDDSLPDSAFELVASGTGSVLVDAYEASRPDATGASAGVGTNISCSRAGVRPWVGLPYGQAQAACKARGPKYRLCSAAELSKACAGSASSEYPYGNTYQPATCNGADKSPGGAIVPTGSLASCVNAAGAFDLSGNASEWTSTKTGETKTNPNYNIYQLHGGSFLSPATGLECSISLAPRAAENALFDSVGFRCCKDP